MALVRSELAGLTGAPDLVGTVQVDVTGGAAGDRSAWAAFDGGGLTDVGAGPAGAPDATLTLTDADARAVLVGELDRASPSCRGG